MARAITKACGNPDMCNEGNLLIRLHNGSNIAIISTPSMETANVVQSVPSLRFGAKDYAVTAYVAAPDNSCKGVIHGLDAGTTPTELLAHLRVRTQGVKILYARMLGNSQTAVITFEGKIVPRYVYYYGGETRCYLYRSSRQVCYICFKPGHRADVCPTPDAVVCSNCAEPVIEDGHTCEPRCALCKEAHPTRAKECKKRLRKPRSPRARKQEEPDAEARNAGGRGRTRKRWFSRDSSSTSRSRSRSRSASKTRQAPETKKKQQKKTIAKKEEDSKQRLITRSGTEEQYAEKEQILQDLSDYARSVNYVPKIAPRSAASAVRMKRPATPYRLTMPPTKQVRAEEAEGQGQHAAQLLLTMPDQTPSSPSVIVGYMEATDQHTIEIIPDNQQPLKEEDEEEQLQRTQLQRQQIQPPPVARQQALPAMNEGIRGLEGMELNLLTMRQSHEFELRQKELDIEKRKVDNEERRLALEARKLDLAERKHQMEVSCRQREHQELLQHIEQFFSKHTKKISDLINTRQVSHE
ncbi:hypothetical protein HPB49_008963 [Dermacentor silvarum]|uniref:Uncharacterized protein n=1 Tax=Dermacentor silvarum TaxID=543639 RepID=A0ACB8D443_DERSI|nr:hypothetical protein HPB49_008963 [Dermacentor silvarum]